MVVRIRFGKGPKLGTRPRTDRRLALGIAALLPPAAFLAGALGMWRIGADLNWTHSFAFPSGIFSHWQVWMGAAIALQLCARTLTRYGKDSDRTVS